MAFLLACALSACSPQRDRSGGNDPQRAAEESSAVAADDESATSREPDTTGGRNVPGNDEHVPSEEPRPQP
jgi:hypothetical protein